MTALTGTDPNSTYVALLQTGDSVGLTTSLKTIQDGLGNNSALKLSTTTVQAASITFNGHTVNTSDTAAITVTPNTTFSGNVTVSGTLTATVALANPLTVGSYTLTLGNNFTTSGANPLTLTTTGSTNVTLPTSGTLVNSGVTTLSSLTTAGALATIGTVTSGTWNATPVTVNYGGTGRASATAYAVLCGGTTSTGSHQSVASVGTSGQVLTSNGAGALPTFQNITSSGTVTSVATSGLATGGTITTTGTITVTAASKSDQQTGTSTTTVVTPAQQQSHASAAKFWVYFNGAGSGSVGTIVSSYNVTSVTRNATGDYTLNFTTSFADTHYVPIAMPLVTAAGQLYGIGAYQLNTGSCRILSTGSGVGALDLTSYFIVGYGTQ